MAFSKSWEPCLKQTAPNEVLWALINHNYSVWGEEPTIHTWIDNQAKEENKTLICNVHKIPKEPGIGINLYDEMASFFLKRFPNFELLERGKTTVAGVPARWQKAFIGFESDRGIEHFCTTFNKGNAWYAIYFWGDASLIDSRLKELQDLTASFTLIQ